MHAVPAVLAVPAVPAVDAVDDVVEEAAVAARGAAVAAGAVPARPAVGAVDVEEAAALRAAVGVYRRASWHIIEGAIMMAGSHRTVDRAMRAPDRIGVQHVLAPAVEQARLSLAEAVHDRGSWARLVRQAVISRNSQNSSTRSHSYRALLARHAHDEVAAQAAFARRWGGPYARRMPRFG